MIVPGTGKTIKESPKAEIDSAKAWVFNKSAELFEMNNKHTSEAMQQIDSQKYMDDISYMDGTNPETYTNQKKNYLEKILSDESFTPPNESAQELWGQYTQTFKQDQINEAISVELQPRISAKVKQITNGVNLHAEGIKNNPDTYNQSLLEFNEVIGEDNNFIPAAQLKELRTTALEVYKTAYIQGMTRLDPKSLMMEITAGKHKEVGEAHLDKYYIGALSSYKVKARQDVGTIVDLLTSEYNTLLENGGDLESTRLASLDPKAISSDEMMIKLTMHSDWFNNIALEEVDGQAYIFDNKLSVNSAIENDKAIPVKDVKQGKRIFKQLARMLG